MKLRHKHNSRIRSTKRTKILLTLVLLTVFAGIGTYVITRPKAAVGPGDPNATANARAVLAYLQALGDTDKVLSGQQGVVKNFDLSYEFDTVQSQTGSKPAIMGIDYFHWTENGSGYQFDSATSNARAKAHWNAGGLIKMSSHVYNPITGQSGNTNGAAFPSNGQVGQMVVEGTSENTALKNMLNKIVGGLTDLQNSGVVVIYSPWHEWNFWWSNANNGISHANLRALWRYTRNYIVGQGVHNVLWSYGPKADGNDPNIMTTLYPGDDVVDVIAPSLYAEVNTGDTFGHYNAMIATGKPFLLGEFGVMAYPSFQAVKGYDQKNRLLTAITNKNPKTVGVMNWWSDFGIHNTASGGAPYMQDSRVLNLGEVNWQAYLGGTSPTPPVPPPTPPTPPSPQPDLIVTGVAMSPTTPVSGQNVTLTATVKNQGTAATPTGTVIGVAYSVDGQFVSWSDSSSTSLAAGASRTLTANSGPDGDAFWTPNAAGSYILSAEVNNPLSDGRRFAESDESNNVKTDTVTVVLTTFRAEDINQDGVVNLQDFSLLAANFGKSSGLTNPRADINSDGIVNLQDFSLLAGKFGS